MSVIDPTSLALENILPGTVISIAGTVGSGKTTLARSIIRSIRESRTASVHVVADDERHLDSATATHLEYGSVEHTGSTVAEPADILVFDSHRHPPVIDVPPASVVLVIKEVPFEMNADINVLLGRATRNGFNQAFGFEFPLRDGVPELLRGTAYIARAGQKPVVVTFVPA